MGFLSSRKSSNLHYQGKDRCDFGRASRGTLPVSDKCLGRGCSLSSSYTWCGNKLHTCSSWCVKKKRDVVTPFPYFNMSLWSMMGAALAVLPFLSYLYFSPETHGKAESLPQALQLQVSSNHTGLLGQWPMILGLTAH